MVFSLIGMIVSGVLFFQETEILFPNHDFRVFVRSQGVWVFSVFLGAFSLIGFTWPFVRTVADMVVSDADIRESEKRLNERPMPK